MPADTWVRLNGVTSEFQGVYIGPIDAVRGRIDHEGDEALVWTHTEDGLIYVGTRQDLSIVTIKNVDFVYCGVHPGDAGVFAPADRFLSTNDYY